MRQLSEHRLPTRFGTVLFALFPGLVSIVTLAQ